MRINRVEANKLAFKSIRTDKKTIEQLKTGTKPIIENNRLNILTALNSLSSQPNRGNIEFLLDVADNLAYGQGGEKSKFQTTLDNDGFSLSERENMDWSKALKDTISLALSASPEDVSDLQEKFEQVFAPKKELTKEQAEVLSIRNSLIGATINDRTLEDEETLSRTTNVLKNLDYFVASSEIPMAQKKDVLGKLVHFMSDDYKINPQLEDKKLQVLDEVLGDMVIKTPEDDVLTIKPVDQRQSGICAAISICRKHMAYEDKSKYIDLIMDELSASDKMKVYDITELGTGKQIEIVKPEIEYNTALKNGYRIIDTSAHIWMHNAHASGDGSIQTEYYIAFDDDNYGIFNDSSWYLGLDKEVLPEKLFLSALIKEREYLKSFQKTQRQFKEAQRNISAVKKEAVTAQTVSRLAFSEILKGIFPEKGAKDINHIISSTIKFYSGKGENNEVNVPKQLPKEVQQKVLTDYITSNIEGITPEQEVALQAKAKQIHSMVAEYTEADAKVEKLQSFNTKRGKYLYNKKLFNLAAAHRVAMESDINIPNGVIRWEKSVGLPPRETQISNHLAKIKPEDEQTRKDLMSDTMYLNSIVPNELDEIATILFDNNVSGLVAMLFKDLDRAVQGGDKNTLAQTQELLGMPNKSKNEIHKELIKLAEEIETNPTEEKVLEGTRTLGYEDRIHFLNQFIGEYYNSLLNGISEEEAENLATKFGGMDKISSGLEAQRIRFENARQKRDSTLEKWEVPSARALILDRLEHKYKLISRTKLDTLKNRFATIQVGMIQNEKIPNTKERAKANEKLYEFTEEEQKIFEQIEQQTSSMKKYSKTNYLAVNKALFSQLEQQYANIGMLNGQFWVREEGSSGLSANEQIRIIEQMTGKPFHMERDIKKAAEQIKQGNGSGIISMSVLDDDYGFHAQYIPSVTTESIKNAITGETEEKDIVWTDNSWGNSEKNSFWNAHDGFLHTDYGSGYGWKNGFFLAPNHTIGLAVDDIHGAIGVATSDDNEKFGLFTDVVLQGTPTDTYQKLYKVYNQIIHMDDVFTELDALETALTSGYKFSIKELEGLDELAGLAYERVSKRAEKEITSEEEYDKLSPNDELRFAFDKLALMMSTENPALADGILTVNNAEDLEKVKEELFQASVENLGGLLGKSDDTFDTIFNASSNEITGLFAELESKFNITLTEEQQKDFIEDIFSTVDSESQFDGRLTSLKQYLQNKVVQATMKHLEDKNNDDAEYFFVSNAQKIILDNIEKHVRIKSLDDPILKNAPLGQNLIDSIDKHLGTKSDKELLDFIQALQHANFETADKFFEMLEPEDVGIHLQSGYDILKRFKADDTVVSKALSESIATQVINKNLRTAYDQNKSTPEECYRDLYVKLSDMDVQKYIKAFKAEAFQKYKVRQAFPEPVVLKDSDITEFLAKNIITLQEGVTTVSSQQLGIDILSTYHRITDDFANTETFKALSKKQDVIITDENKEEIEALLKEFITLSVLTASDSTIQDVNKKIGKLVGELSTEDGKISGLKAGRLLNDILIEFSNVEKSGNNLNKYIQEKNAAIKALNDHIDFLVTSNIDPKHRNEVRRKFNQILTAYKNELPEEEIDVLEEELDGMFIDKHIVRNPKVLLKEVIQMLLDGKQNTQSYTGLKTYLEMALQVAQQTKIQYKLVQNQHEGISSKTKSLLGLFKVFDGNGKPHSMDSDLGMGYFVEKLMNKGDNHTTLNLFLEQSGLTSKALSALIGTINIDEARKDFEQRIAKIKADIKILDKFASKTNAYFERRHIPCKNWEQTVDAFISYAQRQLKPYKDTNIYTYYMECLNSIRKMDSFDGQSITILNDILKDGNLEALYQTAQTINAKLSEIGEYTKLLKDRMELICSIRVPQSTEASQKRVEFMKQYNEIDEYLDQESALIQTLIQNSDALSTMQS